MSASSAPYQLMASMRSGWHLAALESGSVDRVEIWRCVKKPIQSSLSMKKGKPMTTTATAAVKRTQGTGLPTFKRRYMNDREIELFYGITRRRLQTLRQLNEGPPYRKFGHRTVLYEVAAFERWIDSLPLGGAVINETRKDASP